MKVLPFKPWYQHAAFSPHNFRNISPGTDGKKIFKLVLYGCFRERVRWFEDCVLTGYSCTQNGPILPALFFSLWLPKKRYAVAGKKSPLLSTLVRSRSLDICLVVVVVVVFGMFIALDSSWSLEKGKKTFANIQLSWSSRLALTHILFQFLYSYDLGFWL